jgi:hypothetical protein
MVLLRLLSLRARKLSSGWMIDYPSSLILSNMLILTEGFGTVAYLFTVSSAFDAYEFTD